MLEEFIKVMPTDYKRILVERKKHDEEMELAIIDEDDTTHHATVKE